MPFRVSRVHGFELDSERVRAWIHRERSSVTVIPGVTTALRVNSVNPQSVQCVRPVGWSEPH